MSTILHYKQRYDKLIHHYRNTLCEGYMEKHHVVPKCMGGGDEMENMILLPLRAHYLAHYLLTKAYPGNNKLYHAFAAMSLHGKNHKRTFTSKQYEKMRKARSNALTGIPRPEHVKQKLRKPKANKENYYKPKTEAHKANISKANKGKKKTAEHVAKLVAARRASQESRTAFFEAKKQEIVHDYKQSGLTRSEYSKSRDINYNTLKKYLRGI